LPKQAPNRDAALEKFFPWLSPGAGYRRHDGAFRMSPDPSSTPTNSLTASARLHSQLDLATLFTKALPLNNRCTPPISPWILTAGFHLAAALGYYDLANARALAGVVNER